MKPITLLLTLATATYLAPSVPAQTVATKNKLLVARKQTATALQSIALYEDANYLAKLGDFDNARKLANRMKVQKTYTMQAIAQFAAEDAIRSGDYPRAENEIKLAGDAGLWLKLSKRYKQLNGSSDARRTAFYAVAQVILVKGSYGWGEVAVWLCELGEQPAARRLFATAKKELLDPDPIMGSPIDRVYEVAAQCRFDDMVPKTVGLFVLMSLVSTYASQNRDDLAYRAIENELARITQILGQQSSKDKPQKVNAEQATTMWRAMLYMEMASIQFQRGDRATSQKTLQEVDALLKTDNQHSDWLSLKFRLLAYCQYTAQWELVDTIEGDIQKYLAESSVPAKDLKRRQEQLISLQLDGLYVISHPEIFSPEERQTAFVRLKKRAVQHLIEHPKEKTQTYFTLARAQRSLKDTNWRTSLQNSEDLSVKNIKQKENWYLIQQIATEWREAGEVKKASLLGRQILDFWKKSSPSTSKQNTKAQKLAIASERYAVVEILTNSGLPDEALNLLISQVEPEESRWTSALTELAKQYPSSPPRQIIQLPVPARRIALRSWADGLTAQADTKENEDLNSRMSSFGHMF